MGSPSGTGQLRSTGTNPAARLGRWLAQTPRRGVPRWAVVVIFFLFMLLHQSDKLLIGPLTSRIMEAFGINEVQMGAVTTGALIVGAFFYPVWGYLYDRYARAKLLALASFIWGATTWLSAIVPSYGAFVATRASTGVDDSSYPGLYSLTSDYFGPKVRGKIYGFLQLAMPLGYLIGMILALMLGGVIGWRGVFFLTGGLGVLLAVAVFLSVREPARGKSEPELAELEEIQTYRFNWGTALGLFGKPTLLLMFVQGFFGVFPWNVITYWIFRYLETERGYAEGEILMTMVPAVLVLAAGYFIGGALGDLLFKRTPRGRMIVAVSGVLLGAILLLVTLQVPTDNSWLFLGMLCATALFIPFSAPNVISTVYDITLPEVRSTAVAVQYFIESAGAALAPLLAGIIAVTPFPFVASLRQTPGLAWLASLFTEAPSLHNAITVICVLAWLLCAFFYSFATHLVPQDIAVLRRQLAERAEQERAARASAA